MNYLIQDKPMFTAAMSAYPYSAALEARYQFESKFAGPVNMSVIQGNTLLVPRETCPVSDADYRTSHPPVAINCNFKPRFPEQEELIMRSLYLLQKGTNHIFEAPTGWGKTVAGTVIACLLGQPTMIVVTKEDLLKQWQQTFIALGVPPSVIGHVQQDTCNWKGKRIVLGMVHSLVIPDRYPKEMFDYFGCLMLDEVHLMAADTFVRSCQLFPAKYRVGFSASPDRPDGKTPLLYGHIGPLGVRGTVIPMKATIWVKKTGVKVPKQIPMQPGRMVIAYKWLAAHHARNHELVQFITAAYKNGRRTLFVSDLIEGQIDRMFQMLTHVGIPGNDIGYYLGGMKDQLEFHKKRPIVLGTYAMVSTGTNVPEWDTLAMGTPRAQVKQTLGRITRLLEGKNDPIALDLLDGNQQLSNLFLKRRKTYSELGANVIEV